MNGPEGASRPKGASRPYRSASGGMGDQVASR